MEIRLLARSEIERVWTIDRSEVIQNLYILQGGELMLRREYCDVAGWEDGEPEKYTPILRESFDRGGIFHGCFDGKRLAGAAIVDTKWRGSRRDLLQLSFLHVGKAYRGKGLGKRLFECSRDAARRLGANGLYVSATPSEHTIDFYRRLGCTVTATPDAELLAMEPEDIHLECRFDSRL